MSDSFLGSWKSVIMLSKKKAGENNKNIIFPIIDVIRIKPVRYEVKAERE